MGGRFFQILLPALGPLVILGLDRGRAVMSRSEGLVAAASILIVTLSLSVFSLRVNHEGRSYNSTIVEGSLELAADSGPDTLVVVAELQPAGTGRLYWRGSIPWATPGAASTAACAASIAACPADLISLGLAPSVSAPLVTCHYHAAPRTPLSRVSCTRSEESITTGTPARICPSIHVALRHAARTAQPVVMDGSSTDRNPGPARH